jgi:hypothetical protein
MGVSTEFIRAAIHDGHLKAECVTVPGRRPFYRIPEGEFLAFLKKSNWSQIPKLRATGTE